jgi:hypothetical protein
VRRDLENCGVIGFEPVKHVEGKALPIQWQGTIAKTYNGTIVRMHDIANAGKPILHSIQRQAHSPMLRSVLQHAATMRKDRKRRSARSEQARLVVLHSPSDEAVCVVKYSG